MELLPPKLAKIFNFCAYPRINLYTSELEWWVFKDVFTARASKFIGEIETNAADNESYQGD